MLVLLGGSTNLVSDESVLDSVFGHSLAFDGYSNLEFDHSLKFDGCSNLDLMCDVFVNCLVSPCLKVVVAALVVWLWKSLCEIGLSLVSLPRQSSAGFFLLLRLAFW